MRHLLNFVLKIVHVIFLPSIDVSGVFKIYSK